MDTELVQQWVASAFASQNLRLPSDFDEAYSTCVHWMLTGKIARLEEWASYHVTPEQVEDESFMDLKAPTAENVALIPITFDCPGAKSRLATLVRKAS